MTLDFEVPLDSCQAEAFARSFNEENITWHKALITLSNAHVFGYSSGFLVKFNDHSLFILESGGATTVCKNQDEFRDFFDKGLVEGRSLCRELYKQKMIVEKQLSELFNQHFGGDDDYVYH